MKEDDLAKMMVKNDECFGKVFFGLEEKFPQGSQGLRV